MSQLPLPIRNKNTNNNIEEIKDCRQKRQIYINGIITVSENLRNNPSMSLLCDLIDMTEALTKTLNVSPYQLKQFRKKRMKEDGIYDKCLMFPSNKSTK